MNNSSASESMEIASQVSTTQNTSGIATSERNYDQTVQDIENQNMQVAAEVEPLIVIGTSFNQQQHPVQDIENPNLEEFDGAPPNFVQQQHTVEDNDPNQNREEQSGGGMNNSGASESTEIASHVSNTQHIKGVATSERNYDHTVQDIENQNMQEFDGVPPNSVQRQHTVQDNDPNQNWQGVTPASPSLILQLPDTIQDDGSQTSEEFNGAPPNFDQQLQDNDRNGEGVAPASSSVILQLPNTIQDNNSQTAEGKETGIHCDPIESMYRAALEGDWDKAEKLLEKDPTLAYKERNCYLSDDKETERKWYRPLHVAIAFKHDKFALKLIQRMESSELELEDSKGLTACGYAASSGSLDIAQIMVTNNPELAEEYSFIHIFLATLRGKSEVVSFFLEQTHEVDPSWKEEWLGLLQHAIGTKMYGVALKILEKEGSLATMSNEQGTALHVLARQDISAASTGKPAMIFKSIFGTTLKEIKTKVLSFVWKIHNKFNTRFNNKDVKIYDSGRQGQEEMPPDFRLLAKKLLAKIQEMNEPSALELLNKPVPILHDAARIGNMELILMLTRAYPDLIWQTDEKGRSLFSIAIKCREANVFSFIQRFGALDISCFFQKDENKGNNLLHLAAKLGSRKNTIPALQMQSELAWYKAVEAMLPLKFIEEKNNDKKTPRDLFVATHEKLLEESKAWMKSTADSCMLIATIILTVVYAAAFTVPGGNNEATGLPILVKSNWLTCFFIFEALALFSSTLCIITFWSITCSGFVEDQFLYILPYQLRLGFTALFGSLIGAISAFLSAYHMVLVEGKAWLVKSFLLLIYAILVLAICGRFSELWYKTKLPECLPQMMSKGNSQGPYTKRGKSKTDKRKADDTGDKSGLDPTNNVNSKDE